MAKLQDIIGKPLSGEWGNDDDEGIGVPVLRTTNFTNDGVINFSNVVTRLIPPKNLSAKYLRTGDIIIEKSGGSDKQPVGRVVYFDGPDNTFLFNNFTGVLRINDPGKWDARYLFYTLFASYQKGGTRKYQNKTTGLHNLKTDQFIQDFEVPDYSREMQQYIVTVLDKVNNLIALRKKQLDKLDELVKARFVEMFGDPVSNPKKWEKVSLGKRCNIITGNTPPRAEHENYGTFIEWIKSDNINTPHTYLTEAQEYLSEIGFQKCRYVDAGSLLMTCIAGSIGCIGNVAVANRRVAFNQQINAIVQESDEVLYIYWLMLLSKPAIHNTINMALKGILSKSQLSEMKFPFPPLKLQKQFSVFVDQAEKCKLTIQQGLDKLEMMKKALMQRYFG